MKEGRVKSESRKGFVVAAITITLIAITTAAITAITKVGTMDEKKKLIEKLKKAGLEHDASLLERETTELDVLDTPFLGKGKIYKITAFAPTRPIIIYVGIDGEENAYHLNGNADKFLEFVSKSSLRIDTRHFKVEYAKVYLRVVYSPVKRLVILETIEDLKERPSLSEKEKRKFTEFQRKFKEVIKAPECVDKKCLFFVVKGQELFELELLIHEDGKIQVVKETLLESDLLIPYAL